MNEIDTKLSSADRKPSEDVDCAFRALSDHPISACFSFFPLPVLVLNECRQVVFFNRAVENMLGDASDGSLVGHRPGEILRCAYAGVDAKGCGASQYCRECGALLTMLDSIESSKASAGECQLLRVVDGETHALDLRIHSVPFELMGSRFYVVTLEDIASEKRREVMERVFFHDILNSAGSALSLVKVLGVEGYHLPELKLLDKALTGLVEEIKTHKELLLVEKGEYDASRITIQSKEMVELVANELGASLMAEDKTVRIDPDTENVPLKADYSLLRRVLVNMVKNGLEATSPGGVVRVGSRLVGDRVAFEVHNDQVMAQSVQLQVFKRSFSTKGKGRGLGTYSIKLLTENYLDGTAEFFSAEGQGTVFRVLFDAV